MLLIMLNCINESIPIGRSYDYGYNITISDCIFTRSQQYNSYGGVIALVNCNIGLYISDTIFKRCSIGNNNLGGCIFLKEYKKSVFMVKRTCAYNCSSNRGHFCHVEQIDSGSSYLCDFSSLFCSFENEGRSVLSFGVGIKEFNRDNISNSRSLNDCQLLLLYKGVATVTNCIFSNGISNQSACFYIFSVNSVIYYTAFVNNSIEKGCIFLFGYASIIIQNSYFYYNFGTIFNATNGDVKINACYIDHQLEIPHIKYIVLSNITYKSTQLPSISFFSSLHCAPTKEFKPKSNFPFIYVLFGLILIFLSGFSIRVFIKQRKLINTYESFQLMDSEFG